MRRRTVRNKRTPGVLHKTYKRSRARTTARRFNPISAGAQVGGLLGLCLLIYGLLGEKLPETMSGFLSSGFAIAVGIALLAVAISIYFSQEAGWLSREQGNAGRRRAAGYRRRRW
ncbi:MAG: hypothetical protein Q7T82_19450 [Armatimonadota bacterium]|nr:hypothetical protein [Armatimonadota bacterium]